MKYAILFIHGMLKFRFLRNLGYFRKESTGDAPRLCRRTCRRTSNPPISLGALGGPKVDEKSLSISDIVFYLFLIPLGLPKPSPNHPQIDLKRFQNALYRFFMFYCFWDPLGLPKPSPNHFQIVQKLFWDRLHIENVDFHEIIEKPIENQ